ncbi:hypothetical protein BD310DRAFT_117072 [Dichomitus squalens]|uniref:Uncharacterized protein n=1 Tax=Dichomitus squalens TaxID=114155 RepID=A0A4Q9Q409_9APHY|nr:hypothetical protein BD310DRAFT_117072 [Dichomitus squalens]
MIPIFAVESTPDRPRRQARGLIASHPGTLPALSPSHVPLSPGRVNPHLRTPLRSQGCGVYAR